MKALAVDLGEPRDLRGGGGVVVVGGGVMRNARAVLPWIQDHVRRHVWTPWGEVAVRAAELGDRAALLGAAPLLAGGAGG